MTGFQDRRLQFNDTISYRRAVAPQNPDVSPQPAGGGPYIGKIVHFTDTMVGVRADGWMGAEPFYYVWPEDILSVLAVEPIILALEAKYRAWADAEREEAREYTIDDYPGLE